ncbi:MAG: hypothetical protein ABWY80_09135, partial [Acidimicrobiia bacterium]
SFDVSRTGVPVMVKTSYYPNWQVSGADGPYRATPNFMVVVPTSKHVELTYGTTSVEWLGRVLTVLGLVGVGLLVWWGRRLKPRRSPGDPERGDLQPEDGQPEDGQPEDGDGEPTTISAPLPAGALST